MRVVLAVALLSVVIGGTVDLIMDRPASWLSLHVVVETIMIAGAMVLVTSMWLGWWRSARRESAAHASLAHAVEDRDRWRQSAVVLLEGLGRAIEEQFAVWRLTPAEREVAVMLLRGLEHKRIAAMTNRSERTVRQLASQVYEKSGLAGRAEMAAFFLHYLILPADESPR